MQKKIKKTMIILLAMLLLVSGVPAMALANPFPAEPIATSNFEGIVPLSQMPVDVTRRVGASISSGNLSMSFDVGIRYCADRMSWIQRNSVHVVSQTARSPYTGISGARITSNNPTTLNSPLRLRVNFGVAADARIANGTWVARTGTSATITIS